MLVMVIKPFSVFKLTCMAALRGAFIVINTWVEILCTSIYFHVNIFWRFVLWTVSLITLPVRAVAALHREKQLQARVSELQDRLDSLEWERKELQQHIQVAMKEHEMVEMMLGELEDEHDEAIYKIKLLESELQDLKNENLQLKEARGKSQWDAAIGYCYGQEHKITKVPNTKDGILQQNPNYYKRGIALTDIMMHKEAFEDDFVKTDDVSLLHQMIPGTMNRSMYSDDMVGQRREVALSQSLFSATLSLLVGIVIWEAGEPCMPLVMALFMVVGMSLKSVVGVFSTIKNKPASDAVALLSLNWFMLGTLAYPVLPMIARMLLPSFAKWLQRALGGILFHS